MAVLLRGIQDSAGDSQGEGQTAEAPRKGRCGGEHTQEVSAATLAPNVQELIIALHHIVHHHRTSGRILSVHVIRKTDYMENAKTKAKPLAKTEDYLMLCLLVICCLAIHFMGEPKLFKTLYVFSDVWQKTGYNAVIYISALAAVDQELHEAATVDGANIWQRIRYIDIPSIMPTAVILLIMSCGHILTIGYEKVLLLQNDLNMATSDIISTYVYRIGLSGMQYSYSTAIGIFQSVVSLILLLVVNKIADKVADTSLI